MLSWKSKTIAALCVGGASLSLGLLMSTMTTLQAKFVGYCVLTAIIVLWAVIEILIYWRTQRTTLGSQGQE